MNYIDKYIKYKNKYLRLKNDIKINQKGGYLENIEIIKELGKGMHGTVYLVKDISNNKYAMKVEQIFEKDLIKTTKSPVWREIEFANTMSEKYPQQFMKIYKYENKKCDYVHELSEDKWKSLTPKVEEYYRELFSSPYCSIKLTSIVDNMLHNILYKITDKKIILDLFIQVVNIAYLINKEGYYHRDFHPKNIGVIHTTEKTIKILDYDIPTHDYLLQAINYGMVIHKKYELDEYEKADLDNNDLHINFYKIVFKIMLKNMTDKYPEKNINEIVPISNKDAELLTPYLKNFRNKEFDYFQELLYKIVFFDKFQEQLAIDKKVELFDFIPLDTVKFIVKNYYDLEKILKHLIKLRE